MRRLAFLAFVFCAVVPAARAVRDPWFPDGPLRPSLEKGVVLPPKIRAPQFPLKTARTLRTDAEIATARANVAQFPAAQAQAKLVLDAAAYWLAWSDADLSALITTAEVPRASELCQAGCPVHGKKIYEVGGTYPWLVDPRAPFKVKCPVGGEVYPDNDYGAYYRSGFKDRASLAGKIVDDGWGWVAPDGERYWFVAHANHMMWHRLDATARCINFAASSLSRAYVLTGDRRYAHKAAVLLRRIAEVYPNMDHERQSRFGQLMREQGTRYVGKVVNGIWEAYSAVPLVSEAYDNVWETIDEDRELQKFFGQTGEQLRASFEANYLEDAIDGVFDELIRGNYGTQQRALLQLAVVRQHGDTPRYLDRVLHQGDGHFLQAGFDYAFNNLVYRDGAAHESPDYNFVWVRLFAVCADLLPRLGRDVSALPRLKAMFDHPLEFIVTGGHSPALGDTRTVYAPVIGDDAATYRTALRLYGDPRYATFLAGIGATGGGGFQSYESLFAAPLAVPAAAPAPGRVLPPQRSRLLAGYGYVILNNPADTVALGLTYGEHVNHYHHDRLHFDLFARGQALTPDLGYPDTMNDFNAGIFTWSKTTIAHNTVTVDAARQNPNPAGVLRLFADGPFARAVSVDADKTYPQTSVYRRTLVMVDAPDGTGPGYVVDFFTVRGGAQHDYSLHGPPGAFTLVEGQLGAPAPGTLAGEQVALGEVYDDPVRGAPGFKGSFREYAGSGFQYLFNVQRSPDRRLVADYAHEKDPAARLRVHVLGSDGQHLLAADAHISPVKHPELVKYLLVRSTAAEPRQGREDTFLAVLEPHGGEPAIRRARRAQLTGPGDAVLVERRDGTRELVLCAGDRAPTKFNFEDRIPIATDAEVAVVTLAADGEPTRAWFAGGTFLAAGSRRLAAVALEGEIAAVDVATRTLRVALAAGAPLPDPAALAGRVANIASALRHTDQTIASARLDGRVLVLTTKDDLRVGLARVAGATEAGVTTKTQLLLANTYRGAVLATKDLRPLGRVREVKDGVISLAGKLAPPAVAAGDTVWLLDVGAGDRLRVPGVASWEK